MAIKEFPQVIFVSVDNEGGNEDYLLAHLNREDALGCENKKIVGMYKFIEVQEISMPLPIAKTKKSRKTR